MLRILVISLFVANLLLLGFQGSKPVVHPKTTTTQAPVADPNIPTIHLFSEMVQDQDLMAGNRQCYSLGPFHAVEDKDEVRARLLGVSRGISERETQALVEKGYWVYMPPYLSLLEANQELLSLQALGLKDIGIIYEGDWRNAISLGYFLHQENALNRKKSLEDRGFSPLMRVQRQSEPRYWLEYEQNPGAGLVQLGMQNRPNDFMRRPLPCPEEELFEMTAKTSPPTSDAMLQTAETGEPSGLVSNQDTGVVDGEDAERSPESGVAIPPVEDTGISAPDNVPVIPEDNTDTASDEQSETALEPNDEPSTG